MNTTELSPDTPGTHPRPGTTLYYSLLYIDQASQLRALDTLAFIDTISTTLYDVTEPQVAEKKIHWWHEELARLSKQSARHPACIAVQQYLHTNDSIEASLKVLSAAATERYSPMATDLELHNLINDDYSARLTLFNQALNGLNTPQKSVHTKSADQPITFHTKSTITQTADSTSTNDAIALGLGQFLRLNSLIERLRRGYAVFSDERYQNYDLSPDDLLSSTTNNADDVAGKLDNINNLLSNAITETQSALEQSLVSITDARKVNPVNLPTQITCQIRLAQLELWKKQRPNLLNESVSLTPLRKFFIAYRCKRRFLKSH